ncbi:MAG: hypothetical protein E2576_11155 [Alcaligenaceae bacterium]|nr:hypothetical protein [Alcaligenaceae bacterium SAGV5]MPS51234.1 hypothetical protein [Alcaligenaceae bacterium SAGV3]MPT57269.1 hypothetical protein [Alcaligenaceae bacterium]
MKLQRPDLYHRTPVREFHEAFGHPVFCEPTVPSLDQRILRIRMLAEELTELCAAAGVTLRITPTWCGTHDIEARGISAETCDLVECADALGDLRYLVDGGNLIFGFDGEAVLDEIHRSNMSKLGADGNPVLRDDGKVLKGPNYHKPDIAAVLWGTERRRGIPRFECEPQLRHGRIVISISVPTLADAARGSDYFYQAKEAGTPLVITDEAALAQSVMHALSEEAEDGSTPVSRMLDKAIEQVAEYGEPGIDETPLGHATKEA